MTPCRRSTTSVTGRPLLALVACALVLGAAPVTADAKPKKDKSGATQTFDGFGRKNR